MCQFVLAVYRKLSQRLRRLFYWSLFNVSGSKQKKKKKEKKDAAMFASAEEVSLTSENSWKQAQQDYGIINISKVL